MWDKNRNSRLEQCRSDVCGIVRQIDEAFFFLQVVGGLGQLLLQSSGGAPGIVASGLSDLLLHLGVVHDLGRAIFGGGGAPCKTIHSIVSASFSVHRSIKQMYRSWGWMKRWETYTLSMALRISHME